MKIPKDLYEKIVCLRPNYSKNIIFVNKTNKNQLYLLILHG